ncbi:hypothetical protein [uncultured Desulfovibrio sp.]|uniref:hypothetical protein n=1 Tax=uncultured Desulfovibrio sp. TaxID=167968 RepID=UPI00262710BA|nr:hypothetical protein [uncultured Desulfovibrio sp.]
MQHINEFQWQAILALIRVEAYRAGRNPRHRRECQHTLFALVRERFGCKYSTIPGPRFREAAHWLLDEPLR